MKYLGNKINFTQEDQWTYKFDYILQGDPTITINPNQYGMNALNAVTGELFFCTDNTIDANIWVGQLGTEIP